MFASEGMGKNKYMQMRLCALANAKRGRRCDNNYALHGEGQAKVGSMMMWGARESRSTCDEMVVWW